MKNCPFCGKEPDDMTDRDTLHPSGVGWIENSNGREYVSFRDAPKEQWCYTMNCLEIHGGCGAQMNGDTEAECVEKWNHRT